MSSSRLYWHKMFGSSKSIRWTTIGLGAIVGLSVLVLVIHLLYVPINDLYEDISFALFPSADKAFSYGELHFNGQNPKEYDIRRAMHYFLAAERLDPSLPYVHHEIARVYFLNGDFGDALGEIDVQIAQEGDKTPNSYYVRGLIEGYMGDYTDAAADYAHFLQFDPHDWAGLNDYSWVLMKAGNYALAAQVTAEGLKYFPNNPWLLNSNAIALFESGHLQEALAPAQAAVAAGADLTQADWLHAYPGNSPSIADEGIASFQQAAANNMHSIEVALASTTVQSR